MDNKEKIDALLKEITDVMSSLKPNHADIVVDFLSVQLEALKLFIAKQYDYGPENISNFGDIGVLVRLNDKIERLKNLMFNGNTAVNESIEDTWIDIGNYGLIGLMCKQDLWPNVKQYSIKGM